MATPITKTWIVVADGARARIFSPDRKLGKLVPAGPSDLVAPASRQRTRDLKSDRPGRRLQQRSQRRAPRLRAAARLSQARERTGFMATARRTRWKRPAAMARSTISSWWCRAAASANCEASSRSGFPNTWATKWPRTSLASRPAACVAGFSPCWPAGWVRGPGSPPAIRDEGDPGPRLIE